MRASAIPFAMLIDGGYANTFQRYIKSDLANLATSGYSLDVVVATHVDSDHISGLLSFFMQNGTAQTPTIIPVREVLHNSLRSLIAPTQGQAMMQRDDMAILREIRLRGYRLSDAANIPENEISARQGSSLTHLLRDGGYQWNGANGAVPIGGDGIVHLRLRQGQITILGPNQARLNALKEWWKLEIRRMGWVGSLDNLDDAFEYLCSHEVVDPGEHLLSASDADLGAVYVPDNSITNGSSISLVVEIEGQRMLFLGDSNADDTAAALATNGPSVFDAIKIAHHGSSRNTSPELLKLVDSPHFFISTNGEGHNHPDFAVLKAIVDRPAAFCRTLHFNYSTTASRKLRTYQSVAGSDFVVKEGETDWVSIKDRNTL